jgi:hypothetical protein
MRTVAQRQSSEPQRDQSTQSPPYDSEQRSSRSAVADLVGAPYRSKPWTGRPRCRACQIPGQIPLDAPREADALHRYRPGQQNAHTAANSRTHTRPPISFLMLVAAYATADTENRTHPRAHPCRFCWQTHTRHGRAFPPQDYGSRASSRLDLDRDGARIVGVSGASDLAGGDRTAWLGW